MYPSILLFNVSATLASQTLLTVGCKYESATQVCCRDRKASDPGELRSVTKAIGKEEAARTYNWPTRQMY
jgi:hypothetical protein